MAINGSYVLRETTANLTRNVTLTLASILTVFVSLALVGTTVLVIKGAENMTKQWEGGVEFIVYVEPEITKEQLAEVRKDLEGNPQIARATYVDKGETFELFQDLFKGNDVILKNVRPEHLPTSFKVEPKDKSAETVTELAGFYRKRPNVYDVKAATDVIREMKGMTDFVSRALAGFAIFLLVASSLLILNTIRTAMFARRREIEVMKLVGATNWFIRIPFILEGLVQGLIGGVVAVGAVFVFRQLLDNLVGDGFRLLRTFSIGSDDVVLACVAVVVLAILLSVISSLIATRRFLDV
jgi:cell division transport system permease protein